jgi:hypothetical protein
MKTTGIILLSILCLSGKVAGQEPTKDTVLIYTFIDAFALVASDDESQLALIIDNNKLEFYSADSLKFTTRYKVSRNAWLEQAYFYNDNTELYYDYGTQLKYKYKKISISTGEKTKVKCINVPKGCGYKSIKYCGTYSPILFLKSMGLLIKKNGIDIEVYKVN